MSNDIQEELGAISVVKSVDLMDMASDSNQLNLITDSVLSAANKVETIKEMLNTTAPHELSPESAITIDNQLSELKVITVDGDDVVFDSERVSGAESFGLSLRPSQFIETRVAACESFLEGAIEGVKKFTTDIVNKFQDAYTLTVEDCESLIQRYEIINKELNSLPAFKEGLETFKLSARLFNLLKVRNEIKEDWREEILNLFKTSSALTANYYDYSQKELTDIMAYFAGFEGVQNTAEAEARLPLMTNLINPAPFRECKIDVSDRAIPWLKVYASVNMMGDRHLVDTRFATPHKVESLKDLEDWFDPRIERIGVRLNKRESVDFVDMEVEINTFSSDTIKHLCALSTKILTGWIEVCNKANKHRLNDRDYSEIGNDLLNLDIDPTLRHALMSSFSMLVRKNQQDLLNLRSDFTRYLVITLNAIAGLCNDTINFIKAGQ